jgi:hypothetical protein
MSYVEQQWQQYVLRITTLTTRHEIWLSVLRYVGHIVVSFVTHKTYFCRRYDT